MQYHKYSLTEIENLMPWERDVYVALLKQHLEEEELKQQTKCLRLLQKSPITADQEKKSFGI